MPSRSSCAFPPMKSPEPLLASPGARPRPAAVPDPANWTRMAAEEHEVCLVVEDNGSAPPQLGCPAGVEPESAIGRLWQQAEFVTAFEIQVRRCLAGEQLHHEAKFDLPHVGSRRFELNLYPRVSGDRAQAVVVVRDITQRSHAVGQLQLLLEIVHELSVSPDLGTATGSILRLLCAVSDWPVGELWLPTPDGALDLFSAVHRPDFAAGGQFHRDSAGLSLRSDNGPLGGSWSGAPAFIPDLSADPTLLRPKAAARAGLSSAFVIPLRHGDSTLALMLFFLPGQQPPDEHWTTLANAVAVELGAVFHRARMEEQLDTFFNHSLDLHCVAGFDGFLKRVNPAWTRLLGYDTAELLSRPLIELVHPDDQPRFLANLSQLGLGENLTALELRCRGKDGTERCLLWNATPLPSQHLIIATARDITQRKAAEAAVLQSEEHYRDLFHQAYQMQENLRKVSDRALKIQEHERSRISRDLHDEVGQALTAINMNLAILRNSLVATPPEVERRIIDTQNLIEQTMINIHNFSRELRPAMLDDLGLLPALRNYTKSFTERTGIGVQLDATQSESIEQLDSERKTVVYRFIQEGLNNVAKHAGAKRVEVVIAGSLHDVRLQLGDDGKGFALASRPDGAPKQLGLLGLAERVRLVGGEFAIASMPDRGTILRATIPFKPV
jgi:PAS domain S-box-containing protein